MFKYFFFPKKQNKTVEGSCLFTVFVAGVEKDDSSIDGAISEGAQQGAAFDICIETTVPKQGQNLW